MSEDQAWGRARMSGFGSSSVSSAGIVDSTSLSERGIVGSALSRQPASNRRPQHIRSKFRPETRRTRQCLTRNPKPTRLEQAGKATPAEARSCPDASCRGLPSPQRAAFAIRSNRVSHGSAPPVADPDWSKSSKNARRRSNGFHRGDPASFGEPFFANATMRS